MLRNILALWMATIFSVVACTQCASRIAKTPEVRPLVPLDVTLFTPLGFGRGCPVNGVILTARHVVEPKYGETPLDASWGDRLGHSGFAKTLMVNSAADMALLQPKGPVVPQQLPMGEVTERVYFFSYTYTAGPNVFKSEGHWATILHRTARHAMLDIEPTEGSSGGCLFNERGEVIGVIIWGLNMRDGGSYGIAALIPQKGEE